jgi:menaquinone-dependent protoporphyrinogen IX oxidase
VSDLAPYRAVVAGCAIQDRRPLPEAVQWLQAQREALAARPFASFMVCMTLAMKGADKYREHVKDYMAPVRALVQPRSEGYFAGGLDIARVPGAFTRLMFRLSVLFGAWREGDHRDFAAIRAWAAALPPLLVA